MAGLATTQGVAAHVPGFIHGSPGGPSDVDIQAWIDARWEEILTVLTRRALPVPTAQGDGFNALEIINRLGAACDLAAALSSRFSAGQPWAVAKNLRDDFLRMLTRLDSGEFDKLLAPAAQTQDIGPRIAAVAGQEMGRRPDDTLNVAVHKNMKF